MGSLLSSFQRIVGIKEFLNKVRMRNNLEVDGDVTVKGNINVRGGYSSDRFGRTILASYDTTELGVPKSTNLGAVAPGTYTASGTTTVDVSTQVPVGTKAVYVLVSMTDATVGTLTRVRETGITYSWIIVPCLVANEPNYGSGIIPLDANLTFDIDNSAAVDACAVYVRGVFM